ncbi:glycosyl transferase, family 2 [Acidovorax sp. JS42]|nr:glycosyl transferase, family 2 [Acidovorax sp. JS42]
MSALAAPWLSILVPVYNVQDYLDECLTSVVDQMAALPDGGAGVELLVLDDRSTDGSRALMDALARRWPGRLTLMQHAVNQGLSAARNTMIDAARGEYIWFLDSDDKLLPGALAGLQAAVRRHAPDAVLCDFAVWRERQRLKHRLRGEAHRRTFAGPAGGPFQDRAELLAGLFLTGQLHAWSKITRRALWGADLRFPPGRYFEDMATMPLVLLRARSYCHVRAPWVAYRQRGSSILATMTLPKALDQSRALGDLARALGTAEAAGDPPANARLHFALAHQCARNLVGAARFVQRAALPGAERQAAARQLRADFAAASPLPVPTLLRAYARRGWWLRAAKLLRIYGVMDL